MGTWESGAHPSALLILRQIPCAESRQEAERLKGWPAAKNRYDTSIQEGLQRPGRDLEDAAGG